MVIGENIYAMLLKHEFFKSFTTRKLCDTSDSTEALICISCESRAEVDALVAKAVAAGATAPRAPQDHGFMYWARIR
ncbi:VOC family protein [Bradyrhizobium betae]